MAGGLSRVALALLLCAPALPGAAAELDRGDLRLELTANARALYTFTRELMLDDFAEGKQTRSDSWFGLTRARFDLEGVYGDNWFAEVVYDVEGRFGTGLDSLRFAVSDRIGTRTWMSWDRTFSDHENANWRHLIYRAWARYEGDRADVTLGRQRIPLGRTRLWNPTDLFNPIFPLAIQGDQRIGQDGVRGTYELADRVWGEFIWTREEDPNLTKTALRLEVVRPAIDAALMAGRFDHDYVFGLDFARNLGDAAIRGEATFTHPDEGDDFWQAVMSIDYNFPVGNGVYALVEHLWNENTIDSSGVPPPLGGLETVLVEIARQQSILLDRITTFEKNQTGFQLAYEWNPLVNTSLLWLYDWHGASAAIFPVATLTLTDDVQLSLGSQFFVGRRGESEYGDQTNLVFVQLDAYF